MATIDIDFEVYKALTVKREAESVTYNEVLRRLLGLSAPKTEPVSTGNGCSYKGVHFPEGTKFKTTYKGRIYFGEIKGGAWVDEIGNEYSSPSAAAFALTGSGINGWRFWECKRPGDPEWALLDSLR